jgi:hypothetical protein
LLVSEKSHIHKNDGSNNEAYNEYVRSNGIKVKLAAKANAYVIDVINAKARKKIRQHSGMLTTEQAVQLVLRDDREELINDVADDLRKKGHPLLADAFRNGNTRPDAIRVLKSMLDEMESPD